MSLFHTIHSGPFTAAASATTLVKTSSTTTLASKLIGYARSDSDVTLRVWQNPVTDGEDVVQWLDFEDIAVTAGTDPGDGEKIDIDTNGPNGYKVEVINAEEGEATLLLDLHLRLGA